MQAHGLQPVGLRQSFLTARRLLMHRLAVLLIPLVLALPATAGEKGFDADARAKVVAPYLDDQTIAVAHVDLTRVNVGTFVDKLAEAGKVDRKVIARDMNGMQLALAAFIG